jgi:hypothetical protein
MFPKVRKVLPTQEFFRETLCALLQAYNTCEAAQAVGRFILLLEGSFARLLQKTTAGRSSRKLL